jgi:hypothetical protein
MVALRGHTSPHHLFSQPSIYSFEGSHIQPDTCDVINDIELEDAEAEGDFSHKGRIVAKYIARLQGSKAVISEYCLDKDLISIPKITSGHCSSPSCPTYYDTYRRGPTYFAQFLAAAGAALPSASLKLWNRLKSSEESASISGQRSTESLEIQRVSKQTFKFKLDDKTRCVAQIKLFRDEIEQHRRQDSRMWGVDLSTSLSTGFIWAEHRKTEQGYQLLIIEHRFAEDQGEGEVLERDLLCTHPYRAVRAQGYFEFFGREISRDVFRLYAQSRRVP